LPFFQNLPRSVQSTIRVLGRHTLEIYVLHLLLFRLAGMILAPGRFPAFGWTWFQTF